MRSFLSSNPTTERRQWEKELALRGRKRSLIHWPCASQSARCSHSLSPSPSLCLYHPLFLLRSPSLLPFVPSLPLFFRHEPCVIKQLGGAAEREREREEEGREERWHVGGEGAVRREGEREKEMRGKEEEQNKKKIAEVRKTEADESFVISESYDFWRKDETMGN